MYMLYESLVGQCEYTTKPKGSFWCHVIDTNSAILLVILLKLSRPIFPSYRNHSVDLLSSQLTGFYMMGILVIKRLNKFALVLFHSHLGMRYS